MNTKLSSHVTPLRFSVIRSMLEKASAYHDVISLSIGEPDFDTPAFVCEAAMKDAEHGYTHYAASSATPICAPPCSTPNAPSPACPGKRNICSSPPAPCTACSP